MTRRDQRSSPFLPVAFASLLSVACVSAQNVGAPPAVTPAEVAKAPDQFADKNVTLTGTLTVEGNYYPQRKQKILLVDKTGSRVEVNRWLPSSTPPPQNDASPTRETLADYLGQEVELTGVLKRQDTPRSSTGQPIGEFLLVVKSAKVVNR
jgi:hypothetical protein